MGEYNARDYSGHLTGTLDEVRAHLRSHQLIVLTLEPWTPPRRLSPQFKRGLVFLGWLLLMVIVRAPEILLYLSFLLTSLIWMGVFPRKKREPQHTEELPEKSAKKSGRELYLN